MILFPVLLLVGAGTGGGSYASLTFAPGFTEVKNWMQSKAFEEHKVVLGYSSMSTSWSGLNSESALLISGIFFSSKTAAFFCNAGPAVLLYSCFGIHTNALWDVGVVVIL